MVVVVVDDSVEGREMGEIERVEVWSGEEGAVEGDKGGVTIPGSPFVVGTSSDVDVDVDGGGWCVAAGTERVVIGEGCCSVDISIISFSSTPFVITPFVTTSFSKISFSLDVAGTSNLAF